MYENIASLIVAVSATVNVFAFSLRWKKLSLVHKKNSFTVDTTRTFFVWDPYGKPRKIFNALMLLAMVAFAPPIFISWLFVYLFSIISAYPFMIGITGLYILFLTSDYDLLDFAKDFIKRKPTKVGEGDLDLLKTTQKVLYRSAILSLVIALAFIILTIALTFLIA
jgi:hypothetical protein